MDHADDEAIERAKDFLATCVRIYQGSKQSEASETAMGQFFYGNAVGALTTIGLLLGSDVEAAVKAWLSDVDAPFPTELPVVFQKLSRQDPDAVDFFATYSIPPVER